MTLTAVVIGAGWAGEGHTLALRAAGVEVVALCGRTPEPAQALAQKLSVAQLRFDWRAALDEFSPDIVAIATPAAPHCAMAEAAAARGSHVLCDKPLATNAAQARAMLAAVESAGVKHAYASTSCYAPAITYTRRLVADGLIGALASVESVAHFGHSRPLVYSWFSEVSLGGGLLNNLFTHRLAQVLRATGGTVTAAAGQARCLVDRAPVGPVIHDFRDLFRDEAGGPGGYTGEWRAVDFDTAYTVMVRLALPAGGELSALFQASGMATSPYPDHLALYGTQGSLILTGPNAPDHIQHFDFKRSTWEDLPLPPAVIAAHPQVQDVVQRDWNQLAREFVADIRGEGYAGYPTFRDGWLACEIIALARGGQSWTPLPEHPSHPASKGTPG